MADFDAIVIGSGVTGGWAAKELTERGLKVLMIERGYELEHGAGYTTENTPPWELPYRGYGDPKKLATTNTMARPARSDEWNMGMFVNEEEEVYESPAESGFLWIRGYHTGGKSVMWGRHSYRYSDYHFDSNAKDGHGIDWPIRYKDLEPWYDYVETFIGVNGSVEGVPTLPDGKFQPSMGFNAGEQHVANVWKANYTDRRLVPGRTANLTEAIGSRAPCQHRNQCARGCSFGAYFSTQSSTLPAAQATGRLSLIHNSIVESIDYDAKAKRATGVKIVDAKTRARSSHTARIIFVCASAYDSVGILLRSRSEALPGGLGSSSGVLGAYLTDHAYGAGGGSTIPGLDNAMYLGRRPNGIIIPRFVNVGRQETDFLRGYSFQGNGSRGTWTRGGSQAGLGAEFKHSLRQPGPWQIGFNASIEVLPRVTNRVTLNEKKQDRYGLPLLNIDLRYGENEHKAAKHAQQEIVKMLTLLGGRITRSSSTLVPPGTSIHDMGGACMGKDPRTSVTNAYNQLHDAPNVFVTDGAAMSSAADRNPSLTYMALTARAAAYAAERFKENAI